MSFQPQKVRASWFPHGYGTRLIAMLGALVLVGATIYNLRSRAIAARRAPGANAARVHEAALAENPDKPRWTETVIEGPADESPLEQEEIKRYFEFVTDQKAIGETDMPAFWRLLKWSRSRSFADMERQAQRDVPFAKLWLEPEKHRGELIRLRLHVKQIVEWDDISDNPAGVKTTFDLAGYTDTSGGNPYVVVCSELPPEIKVQTRTQAEVVFVGYFLKTNKYEASIATRGAPVLIGRVRTVPTGSNTAAERAAGLDALLVIGGAAIVAVIILVAVYRVTRRSRRVPWKPGPPALSNDNIESWLENIPPENNLSEDAGSTPTGAARFSTAMAGNGKADHPVSPESNGHAAE